MKVRSNLESSLIVRRHLRPKALAGRAPRRNILFLALVDRDIEETRR